MIFYLLHVCGVFSHGSKTVFCRSEVAAWLGKAKVAQMKDNAHWSRAQKNGPTNVLSNLFHSKNDKNTQNCRGTLNVQSCEKHKQQT